MISPIVEKKHNKSKFLWWVLLFQLFFIKIQPNMSEQEKKQQRIYDLLNAETKPKNFQNNWSFFMASSRLDLNSLDYAIWGILEKTKQVQLPIQILVLLWLLLRKNSWLLVILFDSVSTLFVSFNTELDFKQFSLV